MSVCLGRRTRELVRPPLRRSRPLPCDIPRQVLRCGFSRDHVPRLAETIQVCYNVLVTTTNKGEQWKLQFGKTRQRFKNGVMLLALTSMTTRLTALTANGEQTHELNG